MKKQNGKNQGFTLIEVVLAIAVGLIIIAGVAVGYSYSNRADVTDNKKDTPVSVPTPQACTQEAKLCPDGSYVGRVGPKCEFRACPTGSSTVPPVSSTKSGITGIVLLGPTCPVMQIPPDPQCNDKPYQTTLVVTTKDGTSVISTFTSNSDGKFTVNLQPGTYTIKSPDTRNVYPRCSSNGSIVVNTNIFTAVTISCDTGIR